MSEFAEYMKAFRDLRKTIKKQLNPKRMQFAKEQLLNVGVSIATETETEVQLWHKGEIVKLFPYTGWATGKSIKDGRGLDNLIKQLKG
jgi:hypothetical protein